MLGGAKNILSSTKGVRLRLCDSTSSGSDTDDDFSARELKKFFKSFAKKPGCKVERKRSRCLERR